MFERKIQALNVGRISVESCLTYVYAPVLLPKGTSVY